MANFNMQQMSAGLRLLSPQFDQQKQKLNNVGVNKFNQHATVLVATMSASVLIHHHFVDKKGTTKLYYGGRGVRDADFSKSALYKWKFASLLLFLRGGGGVILHFFKVLVIQGLRVSGSKNTGELPSAAVPPSCSSPFAGTSVEKKTFKNNVKILPSSSRTNPNPFVESDRAGGGLFEE
ncbi:hypothetical protein ACFE04_011129 [Oxalis oulophora]